MYDDVRYRIDKARSFNFLGGSKPKQYAVDVMFVKLGD